MFVQFLYWLYVIFSLYDNVMNFVSNFKRNIFKIFLRFIGIYWFFNCIVNII